MATDTPRELHPVTFFKDGDDPSIAKDFRPKRVGTVDQENEDAKPSADGPDRIVTP